MFWAERLARDCCNFWKEKDVRAADELWKLRRGDGKELSAEGGGGEGARGERRRVAKFYHDIL